MNIALNLGFWLFQLDDLGFSRDNSAISLIDDHLDIADEPPSAVPVLLDFELSQLTLLLVLGLLFASIFETFQQCLTI